MHHGCVAGANDGEEASGRVVADIAKLSVGREECYTRELATDHEAYLSGYGESPGRWYGAGARGLGLAGEASVAEFEAMFEGRDPTTGELLGPGLGFRRLRLRLTRLAARDAAKRAIRQMNVPQSEQGYPSDARSSLPQARQIIASCSFSSGRSMQPLRDRARPR